MRASILVIGALAVVASMSSLGCLRTTSYKCTTNAQCGGSGVCERDVGYCSFPDSSCGRRFGDSAGDLSNQCVAQDAGVTIDVPISQHDAGFDAPPINCPGDYLQLPTSPAHRYKLLAAPAIWDDQRLACVSSFPTHLAIPDGTAEQMALDSLAGTTSYWIGVDDIAQEGTFLTVLGAAPAFTAWASGQPDDKPNPTSDCALATPASHDWDDQKCGDSHIAICECEP